MRSTIAFWILVTALGTGGIASAQEDGEPASKAKKGKPAKTKKKKKDAGPAEKSDEGEVAAKTAVTPAGSPVMAIAQSARLGVEYHLGMQRNDHGLELTDAFTPPPTFTTSMRALKLNLSGEFNAKSEFEVKIDFTGGVGSVELGRGIWWASKVFGLAAGVNYVAQGGFEFRNVDYKSLVLSPYNASLAPLPSSAPMLEILLKVAGQISLQVTEDKLVASTAPTLGGPEVVSQPALFVEWAGDIKVVKPLVQFGSYDKGRSKYIGAGVGLELKTFSVYLDFVNDIRSNKYQNPLVATEQERFDTTYRMIAVEGALELMKASELFFKLSTLQVITPDEEAFGLEENDFNEEPASVETLTDNALTVLVGYRHGLVEKFFRPYFAVSRVSGSFQDPEDPETPLDRAELSIYAGVVGEL